MANFSAFIEIKVRKSKPELVPGVERENGQNAEPVVALTTKYTNHTKRGQDLFASAWGLPERQHIVIVPAGEPQMPQYNLVALSERKQRPEHDVFASSSELKMQEHDVFASSEEKHFPPHDVMVSPGEKQLPKANVRASLREKQKP